MATRHDDHPSAVRDREPAVAPADRGRSWPTSDRVAGYPHDRYVYDQGASWGWVWIVAGLAVLLLLAIFLAPLFTAELDSAAAGAVRPVTVDAIADNPAAYVGQTVMVSGEVDSTVGPRSFIIEDDDLLFDEELLVVSARPLVERTGQPFDVGRLADQRVQLSGTVRFFSLVDVERQIGADLDDQLFATWAGRPVLIADSVRLSSPPAPAG